MDIIDTAQLIRFFAALIFVLSLMGGLAIAVKFFNKNHPIVPGHKKRLRIIEILALDPKRKIMIIERDTTQHLIILGPTGETVIESNIESQQDEHHEAEQTQ